MIVSTFTMATAKQSPALEVLVPHADLPTKV